MDRAASPDLDENEIPYDKEFEHDPLYDANIHTQHAEARIHALRARLQKNKRKDLQQHILHDSQNKVQDTLQEEKQLMMRIRQMEEMIRRRDEVNNRYAIQLNDMVRKDGEVESLKVENIALQKKLELIKNSLAKHEEEQAGYDREKGESTYSKEELERLRDEKRRRLSGLWETDDKLKSLKDENDARSHEIKNKKAELEKLRATTKELSKSLYAVGNKKDEALQRLSWEKKSLEGELARKKEEKTRVTETHQRLQKDVKQREEQEEKITDQLRARDGELDTLRGDKKGLDSQIAVSESLRKRLAKLSAKIKETDEELTRRTRKYESLASEEADLMKEVEAQRLNVAKGHAAYHELEKKIAAFQSTIAGSHDQEIALLGKIDHVQQEIDEIKPKYTAELHRHSELERENAILKQMLAELAESSLLSQRKLKEELEEWMSKEAETSKQQARIKQMLNDAVAKNGGFKDKIESYKALQEKEDEDDELEMMTVEESEAEVKLQGRMTKLLKRGHQRDRALAQASEIEEKMSNQLADIEKKKAAVQKEVSQREQVVTQLQTTLVKKERAKVKQKEDNHYQYQARTKALKAEIEDWQEKARTIQQETARRPSQIEAQNNRLESLNEQIYVRDQQIETLHQAIHTTKLASGKKPIVTVKRMHHSYKVTAVIDHRPKIDEVTYYKHRNPVNNHVVYLHDKMPEISIETARERKRRKEAKLRRMHERRPSMS